MSVKCLKCQHENPDDTIYCGKCASPVAMPEGVSITKTIQTPSTGVQIGTTFANRYRIVDELGRGGMGVVYEAEDLRLERHVALKFLPPELTQNKEAKDRFVLEAKAAAAISHPNICTIHEIDEFEGQTFIAMEFVEGHSLRDRVKRGAIDLEGALSIAVQAASGLEEAHKKGVIHRDIKSANIMVTQAGQAKIMDFGLAKVSESALITREGITMGTVAYMSPEQARGDKVDYRTDIWSFGIVLYEMISGQLPFWGDKEASVLYSIEHKEHKPIRAFNPDVPSEFEAIIDRCLQKKPEARYNSAIDVVSDLRMYQNNLRAEEAGFFNFKSLLRCIRQPRIAVPVILTLALITVAAIWYFNRQAKIRWAREVALPEIERLCTEDDYTPAYQLALIAKKYTPDDQGFADIWDEVVGKFSIQTEPAGAEVYVRDYADTEQEWILLGQTPMDEAVTSRGFKHLKISKPGHEDMEACLYLSSFPWDIRAKLDVEGTIPQGMVHINAASYSTPAYGISDDFPFTPTLAGLGHLKPVVLGEYLIDKHEVSNAQYKKFIDDGGYSNRKYWNNEFIKDDQSLTWEEAMQEFVDTTGRPGPATWELGHYPEGEDDYPVRGISWYEAAAFAEYAGKKLPSVYHWNFAYGILDSIVGGASENAYILPKSNFRGSGPLPISQSQALSAHGVCNLVGNVKEWCWNGTGDNRYILGGAWDDPQYMSQNTENFPPFFRRHNFGFRCMKFLSENEASRASVLPVETIPSPDFSQFEPCSDEVFQVLKSLYDYVPTELDAVVHSKEDWYKGIITEEVSFNAAYGGERMIAYLFLPKDGKPPYQVMIYFPGGAAFWGIRSIKEYGPKDQIDFLVRNNRAVVFPVYKGSFQRPFEPVKEQSELVWRDRHIKRIQDLRRTIDYLESRQEFNTDKIGFYGISAGAYFASIVPAIEERIKLIIVAAMGLSLESDYISQFNFSPRVTVPVLMISGRYDSGIPIETRIKPLKDLFGTSEEDKHLMIYDTGHAVWESYQWKKHTLDFLDRYFGPARE